MKLLFFLDFLHFKQTGKSVTGLNYFAWDMGPVPKDLFEELDNMKPDLKAAIKINKIKEFQQVVPIKKYDEQYFTNREKKVLEEIAFIFQEANAEEMVEVSHLENEPWHKTLTEKGPYKQIDYMLAIDSMENSLPYDEAKERAEEIAEMHRIFGTK